MTGKSNKKIKEYAEHNNSLIKVVFRTIDKEGYYDDFLVENNTPELLIKIFQTLKPNSNKKCQNIKYALLVYAKDTGNEEACNMLNDMDNKRTWLMCKPMVKEDTIRFITHEEYLEAVDEIEKHEPINDLFLSTLFMCVYEGIYTKDFSVLINLKASDIDDKNNVTVYDDLGNNWKISITTRLRLKIKELAIQQEREVMYGGKLAIKSTIGDYPDTVFKALLTKKTPGHETKINLYKKLNYIVKEYIEHELPPYHLYISGIMYRMAMEFHLNNKDILDVFLSKRSTKENYTIIKKVLDDSHYPGDFYQLKQLVQGYVSMFCV